MVVCIQRKRGPALLRAPTVARCHRGRRRVVPDRRMSGRGPSGARSPWAAFGTLAGKGGERALVRVPYRLPGEEQGQETVPYAPGGGMAGVACFGHRSHARRSRVPVSRAITNVRDGPHRSWAGAVHGQVPHPAPAFAGRVARSRSLPNIGASPLNCTTNPLRTQKGNLSRPMRAGQCNRHSVQKVRSKSVKVCQAKVLGPDFTTLRRCRERHAAPIG